MVLDVDPSVAEITEMASPNGNVENFDELDGAATDNSSVVEIREVAMAAAMATMWTILMMRMLLQ